MLAQRLDDGTNDPPQLKDRLGGRHAFDLRGDVGQHVEVLVDALAADPADQADLESCAQAPRPVRHGDFHFAGHLRQRRRLPVGLQVQQQQRAFRQQGAAAHRAHVVEQGQQHQRQVTPACNHPLQVTGQLDHRAHQRLEGLVLVLAFVGAALQVLRDLAHFLGQQRSPMDLQHAQHTLHLPQLRLAALHQLGVARLLDMRLEGNARLAQRGGDLARHRVERLARHCRA